MKFHCPDKDWSRFIEKGLDFGGQVNVKGDFSKLSKVFGAAYLTYLNAAFIAKNEMINEEFCRINGNVPAKFLERFK